MWSFGKLDEIMANSSVQSSSSPQLNRHLNPIENSAALIVQVDSLQENSSLVPNLRSPRRPDRIILSQNVEKPMYSPIDGSF